MGVDVVDFVDVPDDPDLWFVIEEAVDEPLQIGISEIVVEHPNGKAEVLILRLLVPTILAKPGKEAEFDSVDDKRRSMQKRHIVCLSGGGDFTGGAGAGAQLERHD
ncbi:hypothetical protein GCM10009066_16810 [Halarchaeum salinum]|uniref:Uncharacterized protein n=1 Tax=Halarchaeum salinum TaxID=489912 RepID=A0AAV3S967_9EURY